MLHIQMFIFCWLDCFWAPSLLRNSPLSFSLYWCIKEHFCNPFFQLLTFCLSRLESWFMSFLKHYASSWNSWNSSFELEIRLNWFASFFFGWLFWIVYRSLLFVKFISWNVLVKLLIVLIKSFWIAYKRNRSDLHALCTAIIMISPPSIHE